MVFLCDGLDCFECFWNFCFSFLCGWRDFFVFNCDWDDFWKMLGVEGWNCGKGKRVVWDILWYSEWVGYFFVGYFVYIWFGCDFGNYFVIKLSFWYVDLCWIRWCNCDYFVELFGGFFVCWLYWVGFWRNCIVCDYLVVWGFVGCFVGLVCCWWYFGVCEWLGIVF